MTCPRCIKAASLLVVLVAFVGCKSKQEQPAAVAVAGAPQEQATPGAAPSGDKQSSVPAVPPKDKADAQAAAAQIIALMQAGDFAAVYKNSSAGFKQIGSESQFVAKFQQTRQNVGALQNPKATSIGTVAGKGYTLTYRLENARYQTDLRLSFSRSPSGQMELAGLNQHDELKK